MKTALRLLLSLVFVLAGGSIAHAQWCGDVTIRDWTIDTRLGQFGFQETKNFCGIATTKMLVFGRIGQIGLNPVAFAAVGSLSVSFLGFAAAGLTAKNRRSVAAE